MFNLVIKLKYGCFPGKIEQFVSTVTCVKLLLFMDQKTNKLYK